MHGSTGFTLLLLVIACWSAPALADDDWLNEITRPGPYIALGGGGAGLTGTEFENNRAAWGANGQVGYRISQWIAAEADVEWLDHKNEIETPNGTVSARGNNWTVTGNVRGFLPRWSNGEFYLLVGLGAFIGDFDFMSDRTVFAARFGGGADIYLSPEVGVNIGVSYVLPTDTYDDLDYVSGKLGLFYRF